VRLVEPATVAEVMHELPACGEPSPDQCAAD
jgi:hypothetical protein